MNKKPASPASRQPGANMTANPGYQPGDHVFFDHHQQGPMSGRVICHGKDGCTVEDMAKARHNVHWHRVLGMKQRDTFEGQIVDRGVGGSILQKPCGKKVFLSGELPIVETPSNTKLSALHERANGMHKSLPTVELNYSGMSQAIARLSAIPSTGMPERVMPLLLKHMG